MDQEPTTDDSKGRALSTFVVRVVHSEDADECPHGSTTGPLCQRCSAAKRALEEYGAPDLRDALESINRLVRRYEDGDIHADELARDVSILMRSGMPDHRRPCGRDALEAAGVEP